jgi:hypothetical protein
MFERFTVRIKEAFGNFEILLFDLRFIIYTDVVMSKRQLEFLEFHTNIVWSWLNLVVQNSKKIHQELQPKLRINFLFSSVTQLLLNFVTFNKKTTEKMNFRM